MIGFFIKKAFYDGWDNLLQILFINAMLMGIAIGGYYLAGKTATLVPLSVLILLAAVGLDGVLLVAVSAMMSKVAAYKSYNLKDFIAAVKETWKHGFLFAGVLALAGFVFMVTVPFYMGLGNAVGFALAVLMFWVAVVVLLSLQWFLPIRSQLDAKFVKCLKKCFVIFFDNPGFSLFMFVYSVIVLILSMVTMMLAPGIAGLILAYNEALRLRLYKYDWLERHPELEFKAARKAIPWDELIADDVETVGDRSFRSFIFPWKD